MSRVERLAVSDRSRVDVLFRRQGALLGLARSGHHRKPVVPDLRVTGSKPWGLKRDPAPQHVIHHCLLRRLAIDRQNG